MITLQKLQWSNFFSYGENNEVLFDAHNITQLIGNNGVGKSSIALILEEVLFNKNSKGIKKADISNRNINAPCTAKLWFSVDNDEYILTVARKTSAKVTLICNGKDISGHTATQTYKLIQEILGIDFKIFSQIIYQSTASSLEFLTSTDSVRKAFFVGLLGLEEFNKYHLEAKSIELKVNKELTELEKDLAGCEYWLDNMPKDLTLRELKDVPERELSIRDRIAELKNEIKNVDNVNSQIRKNELNKRTLHESELPDIPLEDRRDTSELERRVGGLRNTLRSAKASLSKVENAPDTCPTCGQSIDTTHEQALATKFQAEIQQADSELLQTTKTLSGYKAINLEHDKYDRAITEVEKLKGQIRSDLPSSEKSKAGLEQEYDTLTAYWNNSISVIELAEEYNRTAAEHNGHIKATLEKKTEVIDKLATIEVEIKRLKSLSINLRIIKEAFGNQGIIAYKIESLTTELQDLINEYLYELSSGRFNLSFKAENSKLPVKLLDNGNEIAITALSSGELARVNCATLLGIRKLLDAISKSRINLLILDEVINVLDLEGRETLIEILNKENMNTFVVSHGYQHPFCFKLEIEKEEGISRIK